MNRSFRLYFASTVMHAIDSAPLPVGEGVGRGSGLALIPLEGRV
jgi:hypothetical protein